MYQLSDQKSTVCNDGSTYKFFIRMSVTSSNKWNLYLMGGWWCFDKNSCDSRDINLKSSKNLNSSFVEWVQEGIFNVDETLNPSFYDFNHVYLYYCSSDAWSGVSSDNVLGYYFLGKNIVSEVIHFLANEEMMKEENLEVILSGSSAGGVGVMVNADFVNEELSNIFSSSFKYKAIADSGLLWIVEPLEPQSTISVYVQMSLGVELWKAVLNKQCMNEYEEKEELWKCFFMEYNLNPIQTTLFIFDDRFDLWQIEWNLGIYSNPHQKLDLKNNSTQINWAKKFGKYVHNTITNYFSSSSSSSYNTHNNQKNGVFLSSCFNHCAVGGNDFNKFAILKDDVVSTIQQDCSRWYNQEDSFILISECNEFDCSIGCPPLP